jgi:glycosyltransferase involved in cell wall biosynthesis
MDLKQFIKQLVRPFLLRSSTTDATPQPSNPAPPPANPSEFELAVLSAARGIANSGDWALIPATDSTRRKSCPHDLKIAFVGNLANNAYNSVRCLRRLGYRADLILEDISFDAFPMSRPFWEDVEVECNSYDDALKYECHWVQPTYVRRVSYDFELQARYAGRYSAVAEVQALFEQAFGRELAVDRALVLAQYMGHWPALIALKDYDVALLSAEAISLGAFCPCPFIAFPTGGDLFISPFEENLFGLLMRSGYRCAGWVIAGEPNYPEYLMRLGVNAWSYLPAIVDTERYSPGAAEATRASWMNAIGGERFLLGACRQSWEWKGSDRLVRAFAEFVNNGAASWRLVLHDWGTDTAATRKLIDELGVTDKVLWQPLCSKPSLRERQRAADAVADQFVMGGYGMAVMEALAAAKPVIIAPVDADDEHYFPHGVPPFVGARTVAEIVSALRKIDDDRFRSECGQASRCWIQEVHGYERIAGPLVEVFCRLANGKPAWAFPPRTHTVAPERRVA